MFHSKQHILIAITGSISAFKACSLVSELIKSGYRVTVVLTQSGQKFIGKASLEALSREAVWTSEWERSDLMPHIELTRQADLLVVYPASAGRIAKLACGLADDLLGSLFLAWPRTKPILVFPAMNPEMANHPIFLNQLTHLKTLPNLEIFWGEDGPMACGEFGKGRLTEPSAAFQTIEKVKSQLQSTPGHSLKTSSAHPTPPSVEPQLKKRVLITLGPTVSKIDEFRVLTNLSTGRTGYEIARRLQAAGHPVTVFHSALTPPPKNLNSPSSSFLTNSDLSQLLLKEIKSTDIDVLIHLAAVSDFSFQANDVGPSSKLPSSQALEGTLVPEPKILSLISEPIAELKKLGSIVPKVIAFKFSGLNSPSLESVQSYRETAATVLVENLISDYHQKQSDRSFFIYKRSSTKGAFAPSRDDTAIAGMDSLCNFFLKEINL